MVALKQNVSRPAKKISNDHLNICNKEIQPFSKYVDVDFCVFVIWFFKNLVNSQGILLWTNVGQLLSKVKPIQTKLHPEIDTQKATHRENIKKNEKGHKNKEK